jgi:hypothetical protein
MPSLEEDRELMAFFLGGTCQTIVMACEALDLDESLDWEDELLNARPSIECCSDCGWWMESAVLEFIEDGNGKVLCEECFKDFYEE